MPSKDKKKRRAYHRRSCYRRMTLEDLLRLRRAKLALVDQLGEHLPDLDMVIKEKKAETFYV